MSNTIEGASGDWDAADHIGLVVYNVSEENCDPRSIPEGMYVWDGDMWQNLRPEKKSSRVEVLVDSRDGSNYYAGDFGEAGTWMLENLRYVPDPKDDPMYADYELVDQATGDPESKTYMYLRGQDPNDPNTDWRPEYGLLYSYSAATKGVQDALDQDQGEGIEKGVGVGIPNTEDWSGLRITGLCPTGWRLPNDYDWNKLEKEIYESPSKYSFYTDDNDLPFSPEKWDPVWNYSIGFRGAINKNLPGHSLAMQSVCLPLGSNTSRPNIGASLSSKQGGFNVYLTYEEERKDEDPENPGQIITLYNHFAFLWTSSLGVSEDAEFGAWTRVFYQTGITQSQQVERGVYPRGILMGAVRCIKE